jgi:importin subunit beta-1
VSLTDLIDQALVTLGASDHQTSNQAANFIASVAAIEIPRNDWPELMTALVEGVHTGPKSLKLGSYKAIEYICETVVRYLCGRRD